MERQLLKLDIDRLCDAQVISDTGTQHIVKGSGDKW